jgi:ClpP class serine protease
MSWKSSPWGGGGRRQAKQNRLIDEVGGLDKAIAVAKSWRGFR